MKITLPLVSKFIVQGGGQVLIDYLIGEWKEGEVMAISWLFVSSAPWGEA